MNPELIISIRGCSDIVIEYALSAEWPWTTYDPLNPPSFSPETDVYFQVASDNPINNCCFDYRLIGEEEPSYNRTEMITVPTEWPLDKIVLYTKECEGPCRPRYKNIETLVGKANCICTNIGVEVVSICPELVGWYQWFAIVDRCIPEDPEFNPYGLSFHVIMVVLDPNYLLQTIECICGGKSNPEYLPLWDPN